MGYIGEKALKTSLSKPDNVQLFEIAPGSDGTRASESVEQQETAPRPFFVRRWWIRWWRHYKRYWICYSIAVVVILAIFLPILFLIIVPKIAQHLVDSADLPIHAASIMDPQTGSVRVGLTASLKVPKPFSVDLKPVNLSLFVRPDYDSPYVVIGLPEYHLKGNSTIAVKDQIVKLEDRTEFITFLHNAVYGKTFKLSARGTTTAWVGKLKAKVTLDKDVELYGTMCPARFQIQSDHVRPGST